MSIVQIDRTLDARGLACPMPIVKTAQLIKQMAAGETIEVVATDAGAIKDFAAWSRSTGHALLESSSNGAVYRFVILKV